MQVLTGIAARLLRGLPARARRGSRMIARPGVDRLGPPPSGLHGGRDGDRARCRAARRPVVAAGAAADAVGTPAPPSRRSASWAIALATGPIVVGLFALGLATGRRPDRCRRGGGRCCSSLPARRFHVGVRHAARRAPLPAAPSHRAHGDLPDRARGGFGLDAYAPGDRPALVSAVAVRRLSWPRPRRNGLGCCSRASWRAAGPSRRA